MAGCKSKGSAGAVTGSVIPVGEYGSLTGLQSTFGISTDNAIELATKQCNDAGGIQGKTVQIYKEDDASDASKAGPAVQQLIDEDHIVAVLGEVASSASLAGGRVCQASQIPMISPSSTKPSVTEGRDYVFRVCFIDPYQAAVIARFAHDALQCTRVAVFTNKDQAYSIGLTNNFVDAFQKMGGQVVIQKSYSQTDKDFHGALNAIKDASPQAIFVPGYYNDAGTICKQAREIGITIPILGGDGWDSPALTQIGGSAVNGCYFSDHMAIDSPSPRVQKFVQAYKAMYGQTPDALAALGYDAANVLFDAMRRAPSLTSADIRSAIASTKSYPGVTGDISINKDRNADKPAVIIAIKNGQFKFDMEIANPWAPLPSNATQAASR